MNEIKIVLEGKALSGKTALAIILKEFLKDHVKEVEFVSVDNTTIEVLEDVKNIDILATTKVSISTVQLPRK